MAAWVSHSVTQEYRLMIVTLAGVYPRTPIYQPHRDKDWRVVEEASYYVHLALIC
jgi:hypothetical protein